MRLTYDPKRNVAYLRLREKRAEVQTVRVSDELNVALAPDGAIYGIELLNANQQLTADHPDRLTIINEASGETAELRLRA